jgi:ERO1-like protein alpha
LQDLVDKTISLKEKLWIARQKECASEGQQEEHEPEFWLDICRNIPVNESEGYLNLNKNPERRTGYNGSHVWKAIYEDNLHGKLGSFKEMDYEERVLYKLVSGLHASVTIHVALQYHKPFEGNESETQQEWAPEAKHFRMHFAQHPERLKNLHFAFAVLLRAVHRAAPYFRNYSFETGDDEEDKMATELVHQILNTSFVADQAASKRVSEAFDEESLFRDDDEDADVQAARKEKFKSVFHNISELTDCITCQVSLSDSLSERACGFKCVQRCMRWDSVTVCASGPLGHVDVSSIVMTMACTDHDHDHDDVTI